MSAGDWNYANDIRDVIQTKPPRYTTNVIRIALILFVVALAWAYFATLEEVTRGDGRVVPSRQIQVVQAPEPGIVEKIFVREGDVVEEGQPLIEIDDTTFSSQLGQAGADQFGELGLEGVAVGTESFGRFSSQPRFSKRARIRVKVSGTMSTS